MMPNRKQSRRACGSSGETYAALILAKEGYSLLCRNYTCPGGEVDLIVTKDSHLCFVEVKTRSLGTGNDAAEAVDKTKISRINTCIKHFLSEYNNNLYVTSLTPRIDVFELYTSKGIAKRYNHIIGIS